MTVPAPAVRLEQSFRSVRSPLVHPTTSLQIAAASLTIAVVSLAWAFRVRRQAAEVDGLSRFRAQVDGRYPELLLFHVYGVLSESQGDRPAHYRVNLRDDLFAVHGLADLDLEDVILLAADRSGARIPKVSDLESLHGRVQTVEDMLAFLEPFFRPEVVRD